MSVAKNGWSWSAEPEWPAGIAVTFGAGTSTTLDRAVAVRPATIDSGHAIALRIRRMRRLSPHAQPLDPFTVTAPLKMDRPGTAGVILPRGLSSGCLLHVPGRHR